MPTLGTPQDQNDDGNDVLADVSLTTFEAQPPAIGPFGASVLSWEVEGPKGFHVELNRQPVARKGKQIVQPTHDSEYRLTANTVQRSKFLGRVQVTVDQSSCESFELNNPKGQIEDPV